MRWKKVWKDLTSNKSRTFLVVISIAVGVIAIGMVLGAQGIVDRDLPRDFQAIGPADAFAITFTNFDDDIVQRIESMPEVGKAEGRRIVVVPFKTKDGDWRNMQLMATDNYETMELNKITLEESMLNPSKAGVWPPPEGTIVIERSALSPNLGFEGIELGDMLTIKAPNGKEKQVQIVATAHELNQFPSQLIQTPYAYVSFETMALLSEPQEYNQLLFTVADDFWAQYEFLSLTAEDRSELSAEISRVGEIVQKEMESAGATVLFIFSFPPGQLPTQTILDGISYLLIAMGILSLGLSIFLIINTLSAILTQQVRQIGIMKAIGARTGQLTWMYFGMVLIFGMIALVVSIPLGVILAGALAQLFATILNFNVRGFAFNLNVALLQAAISLIIPIIAAIFPVVKGTRTTVREAISEQGVGKGQFGTSYVDLFVVGLKAVIPMMKRPAQISLRNTFRRKGRLVLTLISLSLASLIFMSILSIQASMQQTLQESLGIFQFDIQTRFSRPYRIDKLVREAELNPYVTAAESWGFAGARRVRPDDTQSGNIITYAPPINAKTLNPIILQGRWLQDGDTNAIVVTNDFLRAEEDIDETNVIGQRITLSINGKEQDFVIVGLARGAQPVSSAYIAFDYFERVTDQVGIAQVITIQVDRSKLAQGPQGLLEQIQAASNPEAFESSDPTLDELASQLETSYRDAGFRVEETQTIDLVNSILTLIYNIPIYFLLAMAALLGLVGGLGLMGTMSINVIERLREIGVMRAIGASDFSVLGIILLEGVVIGFISWGIGAILSWPISIWLTRLAGTLLFSSPPTYIFSRFGVVLWLFIVIFLAIVSSFLPARRASKVTVREVLSYE
ncbi:MAG: putative ABC transport system permease protein [Cellvibrionaceae bacterium]|jgi:putative ABC transport system permease protein